MFLRRWEVAMNNEEGASGRKDEDRDEALKGVAPEGYLDATPLVGVQTGPSSRPNYLRLYLTSDLRQYLEVPSDQVVVSRRLRSGEVVWVRRDTRIDFYGVTSRSVDFLEGEMQRRFQARTTSVPTLISRMVGVGGGAGGGGDLCIVIKTKDRTEVCPGDSCGLCPGTWSDCPGGGGAPV
jgi:hypothetical protein